MNKTIHSSTREVIFKVYRRCLAEYKAGNILSELGTGQCFPKNCRYDCGTNEDCVTEMNLTKWVEEILIPNLPDASIVVINNTFVSSRVLNKAPSLATKLSDVKKWLTANSIPYDVTLKKPQLLMLVRQHKPGSLYEIDHILDEHGHTVEAAELALRDISVADWKKSCKHVMKIEREYYESGITLYDDFDAHLLNHQDVSISDETSESESEDDDYDIGASSTKSLDVDSEVEYYGRLPFELINARNLIYIVLDKLYFI